MSSAKTVAQTLVVLLFVAACSLAPTTIAAPATNPLSKTTNGLEVQLVSAYRDGDDVWVTLCYEQPSGTNWVPGRHADDLFLTVHGTTYKMSSMELIGFRPFLNNQVVHRCDRFHFNVPETPPDGIY